MGEPVEQLTTAEAIARVHAAVHTLWAELRTAYAAVARECGPTLLALAQLQGWDLAEPTEACICLCPVHRGQPRVLKAPPQCKGRATLAVELTGPYNRPPGVPMCAPCAAWWAAERPQRVIGVDWLDGVLPDDEDLGGEATALARYQAARRRGLSEYEAREEGWPSATALTVPCDGGCGITSPHDAHLAPGALVELGDQPAVPDGGTFTVTHEGELSDE